MLAGGVDRGVRKREPRPCRFRQREHGAAGGRELDDLPAGDTRHERLHSRGVDVALLVDGDVDGRGLPAGCIPDRHDGPVGREGLNPVVAHVRDDDVPLGVDGEPTRAEELALARAGRSPLRLLREVGRKAHHRVRGGVGDPDVTGGRVDRDAHDRVGLTRHDVEPGPARENGAGGGHLHEGRTLRPAGQVDVPGGVNGEERVGGEREAERAHAEPGQLDRRWRGDRRRRRDVRRRRSGRRSVRRRWRGGHARGTSAQNRDNRDTDHEPADDPAAPAHLILPGTRTTGRSRQWLGAVPAASACTACQPPACVRIFSHREEETQALASVRQCH